MDKITSNDGLWIKELCVKKRDGTVLFELSAQVPRGETLAIMGPSGAGKSTLLSAITGTLSPEFRASGSVSLNGRDISSLSPEARKVGILFQDHLLFPHLSVAENLALGLNRKSKDRRARVSEALADIDLRGFEHRDPATLSGGQRARVALMRMLLSAPEALLLDEAFSGLDQDLRARMRNLVFHKARTAKLPVLMVTHEQEDADAAGGELIRFPLI